MTGVHIKRALELSMRKQVLPLEQWTKYESPGVPTKGRLGESLGPGTYVEGCWRVEDGVRATSFSSGEGQRGAELWEMIWRVWQ